MSKITEKAKELTEKLREALLMSKDTIVKQNATINRLTNGTLSIGTIINNNLEPTIDLQALTYLDGSTVTDLDQTFRKYSVLNTGSIVKVKEKSAEGNTFGKDFLENQPYIILGEVNGTLLLKSIKSQPSFKFSKTNLGALELVNEEQSQFALVSVNGQVYKVSHNLLIKPRIGEQVLINTALQIVSIYKDPNITGTITSVRSVLDSLYCEVDIDGKVNVVLNGIAEPEKGDRVILDSSNSVIIKNLGKKEEKFDYQGKVVVDWDHIGGLEEAKRELREAIELPHRHPEIFKHYNKRPAKGILLYGPPGCGKTMLGKATATCLAQLSKAENTASGFIYIKGPEILDKWVGATESYIRQIFQNARMHQAEFGYPAVIFIDEADAILSKRGTGISTDIDKTVVPMFLTEMDGLDDSGALVLLATNRADALDPAVVRDGRIDRKIRVTRPNKQNTEEIFKLYLANVPIAEGLTKDELAAVGSENVFSEKHVLYKFNLVGGNHANLKLANIVNGGMINNIVQQATSRALRRDLETANGKFTGLQVNDIEESVNYTFSQNAHLDHKDEIREFVELAETQGVKVAGYTKAH